MKVKKFSMKNLLYLLVIIVIIYLGIMLFRLYKNKRQGYDILNNSMSLDNKTFKASSKYADVSFKTSDDGQTIHIIADYKDLKGVSAIHIHNNDNGSPGQIIAWLGTSDEWQTGVVQNTPGKNSPCCTAGDPLAKLAAPNGTPKIITLSNSMMTYDVTNSQCNKKCPWIKNGTFLVVHGFNFQRIKNGELTSGKPGIDVIYHTPFKLTKN
jgi:hypothetical protein